MKDNGKRYKTKETNLNKTEIKQIALTKIIITIGILVIVGVGLFFLLFDFGPNEVESKYYVESTSLETTFATKPTQKSTQKPTENFTQTSTTEPIETQVNKTWLFDIDDPDYNYSAKAIALTEDDRELVAKIVMNEFGDGGYEACCLQAQAFRDGMIYSNLSVENTYHQFQYDAYSLDKTPNKDCYDAVDFIFAGNAVVPHRVVYMYDTNYCSSAWHETQNFVVEYKGIRFFDAK